MAGGLGKDESVRRAPISVIVVDDHQMVVESLVGLLTADPDIDVVGTAFTASDGVEVARRTHPDVVVLDFNMPDMDGAAATRIITAEVPDTKVIMLTGAESPGSYVAARDAGISAWLRKSFGSNDLIAAVHSVHTGQWHGDSELEGLPSIDELVAHYQPVIDLDTESVVGFEALVRWAHPQRGLLLPAAFLDRAEQTGFINDIAAWMVERATMQLAEWQVRFPRDPRLWMSLNLSASGLARPDTAGMLRTAIETTELEPGDIVVEITETVILEDTDESLARLTALKDLGVTLALDDFGTAYAQLAYLRRFPFDHIKLDSSFTAELPGGERSKLLVEAVDHLSSALHMEGIAEGIERYEQADCLRQLGWRLGQGFLYAQPMNAHECTAWLGRESRHATNS